MSKKERKLTPAEQKRKADFEQLCTVMGDNGYQRYELTMGIVQANLIALAVMLPFALAAVLGFFLTLPEAYSFDFDITSMIDLLLLLAAILLLSVAHEGIHGICWGLSAKHRFRSIRFGMVWSALTPYCTCSEVLLKWQYILGAAMPTVILGFLPAVFAVLFHSTWLLVLSVMMIFGGGADYTIILKLLTFHPDKQEILFYDHPYECGVVAFVR